MDHSIKAMTKYTVFKKHDVLQRGLPKNCLYEIDQICLTSDKTTAGVLVMPSNLAR